VAVGWELGWGIPWTTQPFFRTIGTDNNVSWLKTCGITMLGVAFGEATNCSVGGNT